MGMQSWLAKMAQRCDMLSPAVSPSLARMAQRRGALYFAVGPHPPLARMAHYMACAPRHAAAAAGQDGAVAQRFLSYDGNVAAAGKDHTALRRALSHHTDAAAGKHSIVVQQEGYKKRRNRN